LETKTTARSQSKNTKRKTDSTAVPGRVVKRISLPDGRNRKREALRRLGIDNPSLLQGLPRITHILAEAEQGLPQVLQALQASDDADAHAFIQRYDSVSPSDMATGIRWEDIAFAAGIQPIQLLKVAVGALIEQFGTMGQIIAATSHPLVTKKTVRIALSDKDTRERKMLLQAQGFLPMPKSSTIIGRIQIANLGEARPNPPWPHEEGTLGTVSKLPTMEEDLQLFHGYWLREYGRK